MKKLLLLLRWGCLLLILSSGNRLSGQYVLDEIGISAGGGFGFYSGQSSGRAGGPAFDLNGFYSHYVCGKRWGFHAEAGTSLLKARASSGLSIFQDQAGPHGLSVLNAELGSFFKLRKNTYHRPRELAMLIGPKIYVRGFARYSDGTEGGKLTDRSAKVAAVFPVVQASLWFRNKLGDDLSWFIQPGIDYGLLPAFQTQAEGRFVQTYIFLNIGFSVWESRG